jgi:Carboxypeptidase regulatory-like domain
MAVMVPTRDVHMKTGLKPFVCWLLLMVSLCVSHSAYSQTATISGFVKDEQGRAIDQAVVAVEGSTMTTVTNEKGYYMLQVPAGHNISVVYGFVGYYAQHKNIALQQNEARTYDIVLKINASQLFDTVTVRGRRHDRASFITLHPAAVNYMPSTTGGIEAEIKTLTGSNNELTSQYSVRGGSYDENLVYVNDFEIYRPFLVRTGQQEGLSFINSDLVSNAYFSVGGFQAKYGDKMSSVLDVTYKRPTDFAGSVMLSLLGASIHLEGASRNKKLTYLVGARQKSNQYLLQSQPTKGVYNPSFTDVQALINYRFNDKWEMEVIGNYARNRFSFIPETQTSSFGVLNQAYQLQVFYTGSELDQFDSHFGGFSTTWRPNSRLKLKLLASAYQTNEFETYDIAGEYLFGELQTDLGQQNFGQIKTYLGTGVIQDFARNYLNVSVGDVGFRGSYDGGRHQLLFGANATVTNISDNLHQWERRDSSGFTQPYNPDLLTMAYFYNSSANFNYTRYSGFLQDNFRFSDSSKVSGSLGARFVYSDLNGELDVSPRLQLLYNPRWKNDIVFKLATGFYVQPPFYREMRDMQGDVNKGLLSQKSYHVVLGADYDFLHHRRPYKITAEVYYKDLWDIDPYVYDNVRIRYTGKNDAIGYVYGGEVRLYADLLKDATSWISLGVMKGMEKITDSASIPGYNNYFPLPNDQRYMLGMYFEDYLPRNHNFKVHLNLIFTGGLPVGPPQDHLYQNTIRLPDYKRADIGFSALLLDANRHQHPAHSFFNNIRSIWGSLEIFNLLGIQNTLNYSWIQDRTSGHIYAVPNRLTSRLLNVKLIFNF